MENNQQIIRHRFVYYCKSCNLRFTAIAQKRARCPTCKRSVSIKVSKSELGEPLDGENISGVDIEFDKNKENLEFETEETDAEKVKPEPSSFVGVKIGENSYEPQQKKYLKLNPEMFSDLTEMFNYGATKGDIKLPPLDDKELNGLFETLNDFFRENNILEGSGKTGIMDIIFRVADMVLKRLIPFIMQKRQQKQGTQFEEKNKP